MSGITKGDVLRSMDNKRLAEMFAHLVCHDCESFFHCEECHPDDEGCAEEILKYLQENINLPLNK